MTNTPNHILTTIRKAKKGRLTKLELGGGVGQEKLTRIPPEVLELDHLKLLDLSGNLITRVPAGISKLKNLGSGVIVCWSKKFRPAGQKCGDIIVRS